MYILTRYVINTFLGDSDLIDPPLPRYNLSHCHMTFGNMSNNKNYLSKYVFQSFNHKK